MEHKFVGNRTSNTYFNWFSIIRIDVPDIIVRIIGIIDLLALSVIGGADGPASVFIAKKNSKLTLRQKLNKIAAPQP